MKYFIDCEFIERGFMAPIDLISIGVVAEDGLGLYMEHEDADLGAANEWVKENVVPHLKPWDQRSSMAEIKQALLEFVGDDPEPEFWGWCCGFDYVLVSQLVGFNDWPSNWPYYFRDIQQTADERGIELTGESRSDQHNALEDAYEIRSLAATLGILKEAS